MTTENPDTRRALPRSLDSVPTPRAAVPALRPRIGLVPDPAPVVVEDHDVVEPASRAVRLFGGLVIVAALVAGMVAYRIVVPAEPEVSGVGVAATQEGEPRERPGSTVGFGQEHTYGDGLEIAVGHPQVYEPTANAAGLGQGEPTRVQVVVVNGTDEAFRPNTMQVTATSGGQEAPGVWDPDQGVSLTGPDLSVPAGGQITFDLAFAALDPGDLRLEITPALYGYGPMVVGGP